MESVRRIRRERGLSQQELADKAGIGQDSISAIETGKHEPHPRTLRKLANALGVEVADFFREPALAGKAEAPEAGRPKVLRPRSLAELLERAGLETRWLTLPYKDFETWWLGVSFEEARRRFWQIHEEYLAYKAEAEATASGASRVAPELERQMGVIGLEAFAKHFQALAAAPSVKESETDFYERQGRGELRQFEPAEREKPAEELIAQAV